MINPRSLVQRILGWVDRRYHKAHRLIPVGPLLLIGRAIYQGPARRFPDGTLLEPGDPIGELHFNNARLHKLNATSSAGAGLGFARLMFASLNRLAKRSEEDPELADLKAYHGVTWLRPHGSGVGFFTEPVAPGLRRRWQRLYFRLLLWAFSANPENRAPTLDPHHYWLTQTLLLAKFRAPVNNTAPEAARRSKRINGVPQSLKSGTASLGADQMGDTAPDPATLVIDGEPQNLKRRARSRPHSRGPHA